MASLIDLIESNIRFDNKFWKERQMEYYGSEDFDDEIPVISYICTIFRYLPDKYQPGSFYANKYKKQISTATEEYKILKNHVLNILLEKSKTNKGLEGYKGFDNLDIPKKYYKLVFYQGDTYFNADLNQIFSAHNPAELFLKIRKYLLENTKLPDNDYIDYFDIFGENAEKLSHYS